MLEKRGSKTGRNVLASSAFLAKKEEVHLAQWGSEMSWVTGGLGRSFLPPPPHGHYFLTRSGHPVPG